MRWCPSQLPVSAVQQAPPQHTPGAPGAQQALRALHAEFEALRERHSEADLRVSQMTQRARVLEERLAQHMHADVESQLPGKPSRRHTKADQQGSIHLHPEPDEPAPPGMAPRRHQTGRAGARAGMAAPTQTQPARPRQLLQHCFRSLRRRKGSRKRREGKAQARKAKANSGKGSALAAAQTEHLPGKRAMLP